MFIRAFVNLQLNASIPISVVCRTNSTATLTTRKKKKVTCAVYGCGLSASGALAIPRLVVNDNSAVTSKEAKVPKRITSMNTENIRHVTSGFGFTLFASNSKVFGSGLNNRFQIAGRVGDLQEKRGQDYYISSKRISIPNETPIISLSSGRAHSLIATKKNVFALGENCFGQCGMDPKLFQQSVATGESKLVPVIIETNDDIVSVHCCLDTSFVLTSGGEIFAFGLNEDGQCGNGEYGIQWFPRKIVGEAEGVKFKSITGSTDTLLALSEEGEVFIWGQTEYCQAGEGYSDIIQMNVSRRIPLSGVGKITSVDSTSTSVVASTIEGEVYVWGVGVLGLGPKMQRTNRPIKLDQPLFDNKKILKVFAGNTTMAALDEREKTFVWGENRFGSLGLGHEKSQLFPFHLSLPGDVKHVALGPDHSIFLIR